MAKLMVVEPDFSDWLETKMARASRGTTDICS
jgi:hypothetical protein